MGPGNGGAVTSVHGVWSQAGQADPLCHILAVSWAGYSSLSFLSPSSVKWGVNTSIGCREVEMREFRADLAQCLAGRNPQERVAVVLIKALLKGFPSPHPVPTIQKPHCVA